MRGTSHGVSADADVHKLAIALGLIVGFMSFEAVTGLIAGSLALLSDAAHMLTDAAALGLSLVAIRLAARPAKGMMTYGLARVEILSSRRRTASPLLVLALLIVFEGIRRLVDPPDVSGTLVLIVALVGVVVNILATWTLARANRQSLNVEGAFQHLLTDLYAFIATAIAGAVIISTGFQRADAIASLLVASPMLRAAYGSCGRPAASSSRPPDGRPRRDRASPGERAGRPRGARPARLGDLVGLPRTDGTRPGRRRQRLPRHARPARTLLEEQFGIGHTTLQVDHEHVGAPL